MLGKHNRYMHSSYKREIDGSRPSPSTSVIMYKVTTYNNRSLGLRNNPTILKYVKYKWITSPTIKKGKSDDGGIWVCSKLSSAKALVKYMWYKYNIVCRVHYAKIDIILYQNSYRTKTNKIKLLGTVC